MKRLLSSDRFSVDSTLIEAWASMKSFRPKDRSGDPRPPLAGGRNTEVGFEVQKRSSETHASAADPEAKLYRQCPVRKVKLRVIGQAFMENRSALIVDTCLTSADGNAERIAALTMIEPRADRPKAISLDAVEAHDAQDSVDELRSKNVRGHGAQNTDGRRSSIGRRTTRHAGYGMSQKIRRQIKECFGWIKTVGGQRKTHLKGRDRIG